jgi:predicted enzyme related to lactoylglutathione lyase
VSDIIVWADIPVIDMERAIEFYGHVTGKRVKMMPDSNDTVAVIGNPGEPSVVSADLYVGGTPSHDGARVFLGANGDIDGMLGRVPEAGGKVLKGKEFMGDMVGWVAWVEDSEGNLIGIQQPAG